MTAARVVLAPKRARPFMARHPWVYPGAIADIVGAPKDGDEVDVYSHGDQFIARGLFNSQSKIRVRLHSWQPDVELNADFFRQRLQSAISLREAQLGLTNRTAACRLVFSESDGLSGLIVDRFGDYIVLQFTGLAMAQRYDSWQTIVQEVLNPKGIYVRTERGIGQLEGLELQDGLLSGEIPDEAIKIDEDGVQFLVDMREGQKTGFYLDQRDNRRLVGELVRQSQDSHRVLDCFCYSGGFGLHAAKHGAEVIGVDMSQAALNLARANADHNGCESMTFVRSDVFTYLNNAAEGGERFDMVILDPPKFARTSQAVQTALRGYRRLYNRALTLLRPEGIFVTCCCSGLISQDMLEKVLGQVSAELRRPVQILYRRGASADHPISIHCPETNYLKCLICRVG